jgi:GT2 family glycosyltransferase
MIGIVTVTYNSADVIDEFLSSLNGQSFTDWRLYVVDNASKDRTLEKVRPKAAADARIIILDRPDNLGVAVGNNLGTRAALADGCETILLLNNDTVFPADLLGEMRKQLDELEADMVIPKIMYFDPPTKLWAAGGAFLPYRAMANMHFGADEQDIGQYDTTRRVDYSPTCCMLIRKSVFDRIGLMDEKFFVYADDADFCYRAKVADLKLWYTPVPVLFHKVSSLTGGFSDFSILHATYGRVYLIRKHLGVLAHFWLPIYQILFLIRIIMPGYGWKRFRLLREAYRRAMAQTISQADPS